MSPVRVDSASAVEPLSPEDLALLRRLLELLRGGPHPAAAEGGAASSLPRGGPHPQLLPVRGEGSAESVRMPCAAPLPGEPVWPDAPARARRRPLPPHPAQ
jgi:hypothetical protein